MCVRPCVSFRDLKGVPAAHVNATYTGLDIFSIAFVFPGALVDIEQNWVVDVPFLGRSEVPTRSSS